MTEEKIRNWPQLYAKTSTGKIKTWQISVILQPDDTAVIFTKHGYFEGKLQTKPKVIKTGKNIGKSNETTPFEQACAEAASAHNKKLDKKYITEIPTKDNEPDIILPMLAQPYKKYAHKIKYPVLLQAKLNGVRCLARKVSETAIDFTSRKSKSYNAVTEHFVEDLLSIMKIDEIFDGELYVHGWSFQQIVRRVKKLRDGPPVLEYWVYDVAGDMPTTARNHRYTNAIHSLTTPTFLVPVFTEAAGNEDMIADFHKRVIRLGYEGTILRNINADYTFGHRSWNLQKKKDFIDKEFEIIGYDSETITELNGKVSQAVVFTCKSDGKQFNVRPKGTNEQRIRWQSDFDNIQGKMLTVRYFELSENGIPIFPVGISIRDYE